MKILKCMMFLIMLCGPPVSAQEKKEPKKSGDDNVIKVDSNLVSLDLIVKDKKGKAVTDLKPEDFTISENGVPQRIQFFDSTLTGGKKAGQFSDVFWPSLTAMVGFWATLALNIPDFTRFSKSQRDQVLATVCG